MRRRGGSVSRLDFKGWKLVAWYIGLALVSLAYGGALIAFVELASR